MHAINFRKKFRVLVCAPANQQTKWRQMMADLNLHFAMYRRFLNVNTGNAIKIFDAGGLMVTRAVPEKHIINFFGLNLPAKYCNSCIYLPNQHIGSSWQKTNIIYLSLSLCLSLQKLESLKTKNRKPQNHEEI